jgi:hypothetical protein
MMMKEKLIDNRMEHASSKKKLFHQFQILSGKQLTEQYLT